MAINHTGYFDFTYAGLAARTSKRLVRFMAKQSIFSHPVAGPLMRGMKHIPVDRSDGRGSFNRAVQSLKDGEIVGVFPEATMSRSFELKEFKPGAVRMAQEAGVPILPTTLWGSQRVWSKNTPQAPQAQQDPDLHHRRRADPRGPEREPRRGDGPPAGGRCRPSSRPSRPPTRP